MGLIKHHKICKDCNRDLSREEFYIRKNGWISGKCKQCTIKEAAVYQKKNRKSRNEYQREYYKDNLDKYETYRTPSRERNRLYQIEYRKENEEVLKEKKKIYLKNLPAGHSCLIKKQLHCAEYRAQKKSTSDGSVTLEAIKEMLKRQRFKCALTGDCIRKKWSVDHIIPLVEGGTHTLFNIQLTTLRANLQKGKAILTLF